MEYGAAIAAAGTPPPELIAGRYVVGESFASGGMGTVHLGRIVGAGGFARVVAIKRLFQGVAGDRAFREMLLEEARLVSRIRHPNVVAALDVVEVERDVYIVMEYVHGPSLAHLLARARETNEPIPVAIGIGIIEAVLLGLHAAHEARGEDGTPLGVVHRDVSPQNILVGADGVPRLIDFGIAKAATRIQSTDPGVIKGKMGYMAPEQFVYQPVSRQTDVYACSVVLWEALTNRRLFEGRSKQLNDGSPDNSVRRAIETKAAPPSHFRSELGEAVDRVVMRGLELEPSDRFPTTEAMATALRLAYSAASHVDIARWLERFAPDELELAEERVRFLEQTPPVATLQPVTEAASVVHWSVPTSTDASRRVSAVRWMGLGAAILGAAIVALAIGAKARARSAPTLPTSLIPSNLLASPAPIASAAGSSTPSATVPESIDSPARSNDRPAPSSISPARSGSSTRGAAKSSKGQCNPPYTIDANGHKRYNPNCF